MKQASLILLLAAVLLVILVVGGAFYVVNEAEQVVITQFGKPVGDPVTTPGLKVKLPFLQKANYFEKRFLEWDGDPNQVPTQDKRFIWVDTYARWRITDPLLFFQRLRDERGAQSRLDDILDGETRNTVAKHALIEVVRSTRSSRKTSVSRRWRTAVRSSRKRCSTLPARAPPTSVSRSSTFGSSGSTTSRRCRPRCSLG
jgi:membrane protease subunit HflC